MKQYVCSVCGYTYDEAKDGPWEELPENWKCPLCGAGKGAFHPKEEEKPEAQPKAQPADKPHVEQELSAMELSAICSNLARGCEKQYMPKQSEEFKKLAEFFRAKAEPMPGAGTEKLLALIEGDLAAGYPYANAAAREKPDRGALRSLVWSEKVTRMLQSLLSRYQAEGERMLENTGVWVCSVCGFVFVGDNPPELCPVCKVPAWKFDKMEGRAM